MNLGKRVLVSEKASLPAISADLEQKLRLVGAFPPGPRTHQYRRSGLRKVERKRTSRTAEFLAFIEAYWAATGEACPYAIRLSNGSTASMDAGVLGFLVNRTSAEIDFQTDPDGWITAVAPAGALLGAKASDHYTLHELATDGLAPAMALLIEAAEADAFVTYGVLASHLERALGYAPISPRHMGLPPGALMDRLLKIEPETPLLNLLVVRGDDLQPGNGATPYLRRRFGLRGRLSASSRREHIQAGINEVRAYGHWRDLYRRLFDAELPVSAKINANDEIEPDGQPDNPRFGFGGPESPEHKALKAYVAANPACLRMRWSHPLARIERDLPSGDRMDVEIVDGARRIGVEVKSRLSGDRDLTRGVYQCVKYRAVMRAQSGFGDQADCDAVLVTERKLPPPIAALAKRLDVRAIVVRVPDYHR